MEELIDIMNQLQEVFNVSGIHEFDVPQIAVVGTQSSGKSSVLEHLVGRSFLPRGVGVVTRCPLLLQLVNSSRDQAITEDYAIFQHKKQVFKDYQLITKEIKDQTELLTGGGKGICSTPIFLRMHSTTFTNLTLVDLPGITKVPVGSQPEDIEQQIKDLIHQYIDKPNCIILVVTPANTDMATCEGLKIAREVDPEGLRTLAVVTKLDLMDEGTDARAMLSGNVIPVKLGIIGVVNRSQKGIQENKSMEQSKKDERAFFTKHYKDMASFHGTPYLTKTVQGILINHIEQCLPELKEQISKKLHLHRLELKKLSRSTSDNPNAFLLDIIFKLSNNFSATINGTLDNIDLKKLNGGGRIYKIFSSASEDLEKIEPLTGLSENDILIALRNSLGINTTASNSNVAFEYLVKKQLKLIINPSLKCVDSVHKELMKIIQNCINSDELQLESYPNLRDNVAMAASALLESRLDVTKEMVKNTVNIHLSYINYDNVDIAYSRYSSKNSLPSVSASVSNLNEVEDGLYTSTVRKIEGYFATVRMSVMDMLPKIIMCFMVNSVMECLHNELISRLSVIGHCNLLQESPESLEKRSKINNAISSLEKAITILYSLRHSNRHPVMKPQLVDTESGQKSSTSSGNVESSSSEPDEEFFEVENHAWYNKCIFNAQTCWSWTLTHFFLGLFICFVAYLVFF